MASLSSMKKADLIKHAQNLTQELKKLKKEKSKVENMHDSVVSDSALLAISAYQKNGKTIAVELAYDPDKGSAVVKNTEEFDNMHMANYRLLERLNITILRQEYKEQDNE